MPAPAYRPAPEQRAAAGMRENDAANYIAPRPRATGAPSPEAMARLQAAVSKSPAAPAAARPAAPAPKPAAKPVAERPRFGIGGLINRMAGAHAEAAPARQQPPVAAYDEENEPATDQDRMEIPAFLRRQAN